MQPCLQIEELLVQIFRDVDINDKELASLARTCRAFSSTALDFLYETVKLDDLVKCLPSDLWSVRPLIPELGQFVDVITISHPPNDGDWEIFVRYSTRVHRLIVCNGWSGMEAMDLISGSPAHIDIFLRLRGIFMRLFGIDDITTDEDIASACRFLRWAFGPAISVVCLDLPAAVMKALWVELPKPGLGRACPHLADLTLEPLFSAGLSFSEMIQQSDNFICSLPSLQSLSTREVSRGTLQHIAKWTDLQTLTTYLPPLTLSSDLTGRDQETRPFPALRRLTLRSIYPGNIGAFLSVSTWDLDELTISFDARAHMSTFAETIPIVASTVSSTPLKKLVYFLMGDDVPREDTPVVTTDDIKPLFIFQNLTHVNLSPRLKHPPSCKIRYATSSTSSQAWHGSGRHCGPNRSIINRCRQFRPQ